LLVDRVVHVRRPLVTRHVPIVARPAGDSETWRCEGAVSLG
jgi:hypothetical protein